MSCRVEYKVIRRKSTRRPALKFGKSTTKQDGEHEYEAVCRSLERQNRKAHGDMAEVVTKLDGGWRHWVMTFEDGSWIEFRITSRH